MNRALVMRMIVKDWYLSRVPLGTGRHCRRSLDRVALFG